MFQVDAIYKAEDALRAKAAEQAAKAAAPRASTGPEQAGDAAAAARGEVELTATLPGQLRTPLAVSAGAAGAAGAPAPPTVGGMMGAVVAMDVGAGAEAGAGATGRQGLYVHHRASGGVAHTLVPTQWLTEGVCGCLLLLPLQRVRAPRLAVAGTLPIRRL